jgi:hypothetical protein
MNISVIIFNDGISSVEKPYPQKAQIQTLLKGGGVKGIG